LEWIVLVFKVWRWGGLRGEEQPIRGDGC